MTDPAELQAKLGGSSRAIETKYADTRTGRQLPRPAGRHKQADRELWKAHGIGVAILMFRLHMVAPVDVDIPLPDTRPATSKCERDYASRLLDGPDTDTRRADAQIEETRSMTVQLANAAAEVRRRAQGQQRLAPAGRSMPATRTRP